MTAWTDKAGQAPGLELWRIEALAPVPISNVDGRFFTGDSYILLSTKAKGSALAWDIHFWLGAESSQDEAGVAAYSAVTLDDSLGGAPIQYRETQDNESKLFLSYFKENGIEYLPGGVDSGFTHVERDVYPTRLLQCKGKRTVRCGEVECAASSLNTGDVFILDMGLEIFVYNGAHASRQEKLKGLNFSQKLNDQRGAKGTVLSLDEDPSNDTFWGVLGGQTEVTNEGEADEAADVRTESELVLYRITDESGEVEVRKEAAGSLKKAMLDTNDCFIVDNGTTIYAWTGKGCTATEKRSAMTHASEFVSSQGRPAFTQVVRVVETGEPAEFKALFKVWDPPFVMKGLMTASGSGVAGAAEEKEIDIDALVSSTKKEETAMYPDDGEVEIWSAENFDLVPYPKEKYGQFYGGDSYVVLYTYTDKAQKEFRTIYFWEGLESSNDEKGTAALKAKELDDKYGGAPMQCRVVQGKEPAHFRQLFQGKLIVHAGGKASSFKNTQEQDTVDDDGVGLFHVKGTDANNTYASQVAEKAGSLNSSDCFVLVTPEAVYCWSGQGASDSERATSASVAGVLLTYSYTDSPAPTRALTEVAEGAEPEAFWAVLGGKGEYATLPEGEQAPREARLFECSTATGRFSVDEVTQFGQDDLSDEDVYLLDTFVALFVWVGSQSTDEEKTRAMDVAKDYQEKAKDGRDPSGPIIRVPAGSEPMLFTQHFMAWDIDFAEKNRFLDPYEAKKAALAEAAAEAEAAKAAQDEAEAEAKAAAFVDPMAKKAEEQAKAAASPAPAIASPVLKHVADPENQPKSPTPAPAIAFASPVLKHVADPENQPKSPAPAPPPSAPVLKHVPTPVDAPAPPASFAAAAASHDKPFDQAAGAGLGTSAAGTRSFDESIPYVELVSLSVADGNLDPAKKELYLNDAEFEEKLGMGKAAFEGLPLWKRQKAKQGIGLF